MNSITQQLPPYSPDLAKDCSVEEEIGLPVTMTYFAGGAPSDCTAYKAWQQRCAHLLPKQGKWVGVPTLAAIIRRVCRLCSNPVDRDAFLKHVKKCVDAGGEVAEQDLTAPRWLALLVGPGRGTGAAAPSAAATSGADAEAASSEAHV